MSGNQNERKKYSKTQRPAKGSLPELKLQERDEHLLGFLEWLGVADATQLAMLVRVYGHKPEEHPNFKDGNGWRVRLGRRLRKLWQHHLINRSNVRDMQYKLRRDEIYFHPTQKTLSSLHLLHRLERNEFLVSLLLAFEQHPTASLKKMQIGAEISFDTSFHDPKKKETVTRRINPDLALVLNKDGRDMLVFVEVDRSTESLERLRVEKILAYRQWYRNKGVVQRFGYKQFRVLFVATKSEQRKENLRELIKKNDPVKNSRLFMVGYKNYSIEDPQPILGKMWQCAEDYGADLQAWYTLLD